MRRQPPLYVLPQGIEVVSEYRRETRVYVRIREHCLFSAPVSNGAQLVARSRVVMTSIIGRELHYNEIVHHLNEDSFDDSEGNLCLVSAAEHNRTHKLGTKHSEGSKSRISASLKTAYALGLR